MAKVFISYRREETAGEARALFTALVSRLGQDSVFMDVDGIALGRDFRQGLQERLGSCDVLLALIGRDWVTAKNSAGQRRLDDPNDFVRLEIEAALKRNIPVLPLLVQGAQMARVEQLPEGMADFAYRNGFELSHNRWESDLQEMVKRLGLATQPQSSGETLVMRAPTPESPQSTRRPLLAIVAAAAIVIAGGGVLYYSTKDVDKSAKSPAADAQDETTKVEAKVDSTTARDVDKSVRPPAADAQVGTAKADAKVDSTTARDVDKSVRPPAADAQVGTAKADAKVDSTTARVEPEIKIEKASCDHMDGDVPNGKYKLQLTGWATAQPGSVIISPGPTLHSGAATIISTEISCQGWGPSGPNDGVDYRSCKRQTAADAPRTAWSSVTIFEWRGRLVEATPGGQLEPAWPTEAIVFLSALSGSRGNVSRFGDSQVDCRPILSRIFRNDRV